MSAFVDRTGQRYGRLVARKRGPNDKHARAQFWCECDCETVCILVAGTSLETGRTTGCGRGVCNPKFRDITGQKIGDWTVLSLSHFVNNASYWNCVCACGRLKRVRGSNLANGNSKSCGIGECANNWRGGTIELLHAVRTHTQSLHWCAQVRERDQYTCQLCGDKRGGNLNAHHIKHFAQILSDNHIATLDQALDCAELWDTNNGITLCEDCHKRVHAEERKKAA